MIIFITKSITPSYCLFWLILGAGFKAPAWKWSHGPAGNGATVLPDPAAAAAACRLSPVLGGIASCWLSPVACAQVVQLM